MRRECPQISGLVSSLKHNIREIMAASGCRVLVPPFPLTTIILLTDSQSLGIEVVSLPLGDSEL